MLRRVGLRRLLPLARRRTLRDNPSGYRHRPKRWGDGLSISLDEARRVDILFRKKKFQKTCSSMALLTKEYGPRQAGVLRRRLDDLYAAKNLEQLRHAPGRVHYLTEDLRGAFSVDLVHPDRLIFECANSPIPLSLDGTAINWEQVTAIEIIGVVDTHE